MEAEREIGSGPESVYVYYFAEHRSGDSWPCKVGSARRSVGNRIKGQLAGMLSRPTLGLVIRTGNCVALESMLHAALRAKRIGSGGDEWFQTSPEEVERLAATFATEERHFTPEGAGRLLKQLRLEAGMTQQQLASATGLRQATISDAEARGEMLLVTTLRVLAAVGYKLVPVRE